jgi:hypothetical protein
MGLVAKKNVWYMVFAMLLLYATTTDFVATTVVIADGQDCNHPWLRIEHKCVASSGRTHSSHRDLASIGTTSFLPSRVHYTVDQPSMFTHRGHAVMYELADAADDPVPLRC